MFGAILSNPWLAFPLGFIGLSLVWRIRVSRKNLQRRLPPGPRKLPILGNVLDMPSEREWLTFAQWGEKWGDITSVTFFGQTLIVVNSPKIAVDMLDKKSSIYSDRPVMQMGGELVGWKNALVLLNYGDRLRNYRKWVHQSIGNHANVKQFLPVVENETRRFLRNILTSPNDLSKHIRLTAGGIILRISHGYAVEEQNDAIVDLVDAATDQFALSTAPGGFLVDLIPILRYVPAWVPGAGFQKKASAWAKTLRDMVDVPHEYVKQQMSVGTAENSFTLRLLEEKGLTADKEYQIKWAAASLYAGGADTTVAAVYSFFLAMTLYPDIQKKAQAEIDAVIGNDRLPTYADRENLPYIDAITKEVHRWHSVVPIAPHCATMDDFHEGYFIPKGSIVIPNIWRMTHDPRTYVDPMRFNPERFIPSEGKPVEPDPRDINFGFGRRICPGKYLADVSVFLSCALTLSAFDISKRVENGVILEPVVGQMGGTLSHPTPFKCTITPRSAKAAALVTDEYIK